MLLYITATVLILALIALLLQHLRWAKRQQSWLIRQHELEHLQQALSKALEQEKQECSMLRAKQQELSERSHRALRDVQSLQRELQIREEIFQKAETQRAGQFEQLAERILKGRSQSLSEMNEKQIGQLLKPLKEQIQGFQKQVELEGKERFSLAKEIKRLSERSDEMSQVAIKLSQALRSESKTQGRWGEMILEGLLEKSGLIKGEQYLLEAQLKDEQGRALSKDVQGKKMRPDALVLYPDQRCVIIDSKVSIRAYLRSLEAESEEEKNLALRNHLQDIKRHIQQLSDKAYDDYRDSMDFILLFIPSEPAYIAAIQEDSELWHYAYQRRILLQCPSNLISSLRIIEELWKREQQDKNAQAIALRGKKLYEKFVGFVENLEEVGRYMDKAKDKYDQSYKQLHSGRGNLVKQADELQQMIGPSNKEISQGLREKAELEH